MILSFGSLLAFIDKYGVLTNQWTWLYEALLEVSMTKIALWIRVYADDWAAESAIKASNEKMERILKATIQRRRIIKNSQFILCTLCASVQIHNAQTNGNGILTIFTLWTRWTWFDLTHITIVVVVQNVFEITI